ncbi:MAG: hypothetical protein QS748_00830 [Candidatus Endonucleobacter bathymodioli]|uniref:Uncharacterized protein n=1 Tax=Candidatus Endonucleibacter bathymodioli TaxID=539814 RepID=A0AA90NYX2_9GAMM|nr:hypothetical protein [Candidatus Endonucleobacter bathymodioli]
MFIRFICLLNIVVFWYSASVFAVGSDVDVNAIDDTVLFVPVLGSAELIPDRAEIEGVAARALTKGIFKEITIANNNMLPVKVLGHIVWVSLVSVGMGLNLLVVHLENGDCGNILSSESALQKIGAVLGGAPIAVNSVKDLFFHVKGKITGGKRQTFMSFVPCSNGGDDNGVKLDVSVLEKDEKALNSNKNKKSKALAVLSAVVKVAFAFIDVSYGAYAAGVSGECMVGRPAGFFLGLFWNGIPSFATALLRSTQLVEFIAAPIVGVSPLTRSSLDLVAEVRSCYPHTGDSNVSVSMKLNDDNIDEWVDRVREKLFVNKVSLQGGGVIDDDLAKDPRVSMRAELMKFFGIVALSLVGGFAVSSILASQTILSQVADSGFHVNGTQVTFSDPALGFAFQNETCDAVAGDSMALINKPLWALPAFAIWNYATSMCQGKTVMFVFMRTCGDTYEILGALQDKNKRSIFASKPRLYRWGKYIGLTLGVALVGLCSWSAFGAMVPAVQQQYLYRCLGSFLGKLPTALFVAYGMTALSSFFIQAHAALGNIEEGVFDENGHVCCSCGAGESVLKDVGQSSNDI